MHLINFISIVYISILLSSCSRPVAIFTYDGGQNEALNEVKFQNLSEKAELYFWDFGDGATSTEESPLHVYKESGNFPVTLTAKKGKAYDVYEQRLLIKAPLHCLVEIQTEYGNMVAMLYDDTPKHRDNFIKLVEDGFYDGLLFHRVIDGFMIQGGDPSSKNAGPNQPLGSGGPGYLIPAEFVDSLIHVKGALAAARTNNPKKESSGSQFYIVDGKKMSEKEINIMEAKKGYRYTPEQKEMLMNKGGTTFLDKEYTVFGRVIKGLDVIDKIAIVETGRGDRPKKNVTMKIRIIK